MAKRTDEQKAVLYAALKFLERELEKDGDLPPGFYMDVTGKTVSITFPKGTVVERDRGTHGDGSMWKTATQNLYGWAVLTKIAARLSKLHQWNVMRDELIAAVREALTNGRSTQQQLESVDPALAAAIATLRQETALPPRKEETPRICKDPGLPATIVIKNK